VLTSQEIPNVVEAQKGEWVIEPVSGEELQSLGRTHYGATAGRVNQVKKILRIK